MNSTADFERWSAQGTGEVLLRVNYQGVSQFIVIQPSGESGDEEQ